MIKADVLENQVRRIRHTHMLKAEVLENKMHIIRDNQKFQPSWRPQLERALPHGKPSIKHYPDAPSLFRLLEAKCPKIKLKIKQATSRPFFLFFFTSFARSSCPAQLLPDQVFWVAHNVRYLLTNRWSLG